MLSRIMLVMTIDKMAVVEIMMPIQIVASVDDAAIYIVVLQLPQPPY